ncbi:MAG TPA: Ig domain-containing protein [Granulicella sp.]
MQLATTQLSEGFVGKPYSYQLNNTGGVAPFTWTIMGNSLPAGLTISSSGLISGTPTVSTSLTNLKIHVVDAKMSTLTYVLPITVAPAMLMLSTSSCTTTGTQYKPYAGCTLVASGGKPPYKYSWAVVTDASFGTPPEGLTLNSSTGELTGTVYGQGGYTTKFIVTDSLGVTATTTVRFLMAGDNTLGGCQLFPSDTIFHADVSDLPVDTSSGASILSAYQVLPLQAIFGVGNATPVGMPFMKVPENQGHVPVATTLYQSYFTSAPVPSYAPIEGTSNSPGDRHILIVQSNGAENPCSLWEMWEAKYTGGNSTGWTDGSNAYWQNLGSIGSGAYEMLPQGKGATDAAGLPVVPLLVNADEVIGTGTPTAPKGAVKHPIRFSLNHTLNYHVWPATQQSGLGACSGGYEDGNHMLLQSTPPTSCTGNSPMGEIYRLKASVPTPACAASSPQASIIIEGLRHYGMIVADNGISGGLIGTPDSRWNTSDLSCLNKLHLSDIEPVDVSSIAVDPKTSYQIGPTYKISTVTVGSGTVTECSDSYLKGQAYSCTIAPAAGVTIKSATGCSGHLSGSIYSGTMASNSCTVTVTFSK